MEAGSRISIRTIEIVLYKNAGVAQDVGPRLSLYTFPQEFFNACFTSNWKRWFTSKGAMGMVDRSFFGPVSRLVISKESSKYFARTRRWSSRGRSRNRKGFESVVTATTAELAQCSSRESGPWEPLTTLAGRR